MDQETPVQLEVTLATKTPAPNLGGDPLCLKTTCKSFDKRMNKENVLHLHSGVLLNFKKNTS